MNKMNELLKLVEDSDIFKDWKNRHPDSYLCAFFRYIGDTNKMDWQVHYYWPKNDTITVFGIGSEIKIIEEDSAILKKGDDKIEELILNDVNVDLFKALEIIDNFRRDVYSDEVIVKRIVILQKIKRIVWNITCITTSVNLLNVKVDAESGDLIEESLRPLLKYGKE